MENKAFTRISHWFLVATACAFLCVSLHNQNALRRANARVAALTCELQAARLEHIPYTQDPTAEAIRRIAASSEEYPDVIRKLIDCWGGLSLRVEDVLLNGQTGKLHVFYASEQTKRKHNATVLILLRHSGEVIDATFYESNPMLETHSIGRIRHPGEDLASLPEDKWQHLLLTRKLLTHQTPTYIKFVVTPSGFERQTITLADMEERLAALEKTESNPR